MNKLNPEIQALKDRGALFVINHSGGKASLRRLCGVKSRRELDECPAAAKRFHELRKRLAYGGEA